LAAYRGVARIRPALPVCFAGSNVRMARDMAGFSVSRRSRANRAGCKRQAGAVAERMEGRLRTFPTARWADHPRNVDRLTGCYSPQESLVIARYTAAIMFEGKLP